MKTKSLYGVFVFSIHVLVYHDLMKVATLMYAYTFFNCCTTLCRKLFSIIKMKYKTDNVCTIVIRNVLEYKSRILSLSLFSLFQHINLHKFFIETFIHRQQPDKTFPLVVSAELLYGRRPQSGAPCVRIFSNLPIREILVLTSVHPYRLQGRGRGVPRQEECHLFLAGNRAVLWATSVFLGGKSHDHRRLLKRGF